MTVTIGGNDVGYVPLLAAATLPPAVRALPVIGPRLRALLDLGARENALERPPDRCARSARRCAAEVPAHE